MKEQRYKKPLFKRCVWYETNPIIPVNEAGKVIGLRIEAPMWQMHGSTHMLSEICKQPRKSFQSRYLSK